VKIVLAAPAGWATDAFCGLLRKLAPAGEIQVLPDAKLLLLPGAAPNLILLNVDSTTRTAAEMVAAVVGAHPSSRIVAMGGATDGAIVDALLAAGALAYLPHSFSETVVLGMLRLIVEGESQDAGLESLADETSLDTDEGPPEPGLDAGLTKRQTDVLALACQGKPNLAIANHLGISEGVVKIHMTAIFKALKVRNRAEAVLQATRLQSVTFRQIRQAEGGKLDLDWLMGHMTHERLAKDTTLFRAGDPGNELYFLQRGKIALQEIDTEIGDGTMFGEIGIFSPSHRRTCSAVCKTDVDVFKLTADQVKRLYLLNPQFALYIVHLIAKRLMDDRTRPI